MSLFEIDSRQVLHFFIQSYLSPVSFLLYLFIFSELFRVANFNLIVSTGVNSQRLLILPYLLSMPVIYATWLVINYFFLRSFNESLGVSDMLSQGYHWLHYVCFIVTAVVLLQYVSKSGMEGNVMGFIFAPFLFASIAVYGYLHFRWVWQYVLKGVAS